MSPSHSGSRRHHGHGARRNGAAEYTERRRSLRATGSARAIPNRKQSPYVQQSATRGARGPRLSPLAYFVFFTTRGARPGISGGSTSSSSFTPPAADPSEMSATSISFPSFCGVMIALIPGPKNDSIF